MVSEKMLINKSYCDYRIVKIVLLINNRISF